MLYERGQFESVPFEDLVSLGDKEQNRLDNFLKVCHFVRGMAQSRRDSFEEVEE